MRRRAGIEIEQSGSESIEMVWACGKNGRATNDEKSVDGGSKWRTGTRLDWTGQGEGGLGQQRNDGGGCVAIRER